MDAIWCGRVITFMADGEAEAVILGACQGGDEDDCDQVTLMLDKIAQGDDHERLEARLRRFLPAAQLVRRHRAVIERVAAALEVRETLTDKEADAMLPPSFMARPVTWAMA